LQLSRSKAASGDVVAVLTWLFFWVVFIMATVAVARAKNRSAGAWGFAAVFFGLFALIAVACCSRLKTVAEMAAEHENDPRNLKVCPRCAEKVKAAALVCRFCQYEFDPSTVPAVPELPWTLVEDHGNGYGVYTYRKAKLVYSERGVKWKTSTFDSPKQAIAAVNAYD
jgi:ribosomal protein L40E